MSSEQQLVINGWTIFAHPFFLDTDADRVFLKILSSGDPPNNSELLLAAKNEIDIPDLFVQSTSIEATELQDLEE